MIKGVKVRKNNLKTLDLKQINLGKTFKTVKLIVLSTLIGYSSYANASSIRNKTGIMIAKSCKIDSLVRKVVKKLDLNIFYTSGYRTEEENREVGGLRDSRHLHKCGARDIRISNLNKNDLIKLIVELRYSNLVAVLEEDHIHTHIEE